MFSARTVIVQVLLVTAALLSGGTAFAQKLYRCGNNFSQTPCSGEATGKPLPSAANSVTVNADKGLNACTSAVLVNMDVPTTHRASIESAVRGKSASISYANQPVVARSYLVSVAIRDAVGSKVGAKAVNCYLSEDEQRVLKVEPSKGP